jgi:membrane protease YdiL (CAAX protease family)
MIARRRIAAVLEVLGVYGAGLLVTGLLSRALGLQTANPLANFTVNISNPELVTASVQFLTILMLQYAGWFLLIIPINAWHRRRGPAAYGLTRSGRSWRYLLVAGLATAALSEWPVLSLSLVDSFYDLGETVAWRQAFFDTSWTRWQFWLFSGVASWGVVAVLEELFFRGYCQRRLAEDWGDGPAIVGVSCLFVFAHGQYLILNAYSIGMVVSLLCIAVGFGVVFAWTRSLIPSIVAHAIVNVPMTPFWQGIFVTAFIVGAILAARPGADIVGQVFSTSTKAACVTLAVVGASWAIAGARIEHLELVAAAMVVVAIGFHVVDRRRALPGTVHLNRE